MVCWLLRACGHPEVWLAPTGAVIVPTSIIHLCTVLPPSNKGERLGRGLWASSETSWRDVQTDKCWRGTECCHRTDVVLGLNVGMGLNVLMGLMVEVGLNVGLGLNVGVGLMSHGIECWCGIEY
jgi:hypothetical protein